jgi:hypothetical protein
MEMNCQLQLSATLLPNSKLQVPNEWEAWQALKGLAVVTWKEISCNVNERYKKHKKYLVYGGNWTTVPLSCNL